ncbi:MAG: antibiotic biosynthesis monooxygenase [Deltaproteobacteria bacterium]|nr:antibiotic biosynthesis monooxygenase [Deltaproteobacteria bacterium]
MFQIARTPEPPYYAVIAPAELNPDLEGYAQTALRLMQVAREVDGFLGIESCIAGNFSLAVSYWRSLEAIAEWRRHAEHRLAKDNGMQRWFAAYCTRIARVERVY